MRAIYGLTLRQLLGRGRLLIMAALAALPVGMAALIQAFGGGGGDLETVLVDVLLAGAIAPLVVLAIAAAAFGNEVDDGTLAHLTLAPVPRWKIALPKLAAPATIAGILLAASAAATSHIAFGGDARATTAVTVGVLAAVALYAALFVWLGLVSSKAVGIGLAYIVLWEELFTGFVSGARLLSVRHHAIALIHRLDPRRFADGDHVGLWVAAGTVVLGVGVFLVLTVRRLRRMDVP